MKGENMHGFEVEGNLKCDKCNKTSSVCPKDVWYIFWRHRARRRFH